MARKIECDFCKELVSDGNQWTLTAPTHSITFADIGVWDFCSETCVLDFLAQRANEREKT